MVYVLNTAMEILLETKLKSIFSNMFYSLLKTSIIKLLSLTDHKNNYCKTFFNPWSAEAPHAAHT